jgi:ferredoxin
MRIRVNAGRCQGHNRCLDLAPELFVADEYGYASAATEGQIPPAREDDVYRAFLNCPEEAIELFD